MRLPLRLRRRHAEPQPLYVVQLHRVEWATMRALNSWAPIHVAGLDEAHAVAHRLRQDNKWSGPTDGPFVTVERAT